jgi:hypothetical protein
MLFVGRDYEVLFDRLEVFFALVYMDMEKPENFWRPPLGRFIVKAGGIFARAENPISVLDKEVTKNKNEWLPLKSGFFQSSYFRVQDLCRKLIEYCENPN